MKSDNDDNRRQRRVTGKAVALIVVAMLPAALSAWLHPRVPVWPSAERLAVAEAEAREGEIGLAELKAAAFYGQSQSHVLWVDARKAEAFAAAHIPGAINLNEDTWESLLEGFVEAWDGAAPVVVYCDSTECDSSRAVAARIRHEFGATRVFTLKGGWQTWQQQ
ncbi:Rhodanese-related sulfurtransferase [Opitutaceae bacterium TAV1]|nr:Rhodanese-related sulfurtransferase [Opitutaceae bacterium TAV1]